MQAKKFSVLEWIRGVRDRRHREEQGLSDEEKLARTQAAAEAFRTSRGRKQKTRRH